MGYDELVVVEVDVEAIKQEASLFEASTLVIGYSIEDVEKHMVRMIDGQVGEDIEVHKAKKEVWTMMDDWKSTNVARVHSG